MAVGYRLPGGKRIPGAASYAVRVHTSNGESFPQATQQSWQKG
jgi:hypothetical protein